MIVDDDADVDAAAAAAVWGGCATAGPTCIGIERVYATAAVYDRFVAKAVELAAGVRAGPEPDAAIGPMTLPKQVDVIRRHLEDALARGAKAVVGGVASVRPPFVDPVVLVDVPEDALVMREETFGPVLPIIRVADGDEAVLRANASGYGLASAVYGKRRAGRLAAAVKAGMTSINAVQMVAAVPALPFGGVGESGFGRVHGEEGLREFTWVKATTRQRFPLPFVLTSFQRPKALIPMVKRSMRLRHGR
jgi:acyl-CoA reductase-like NAD-dependent aldehyde dehydrogenase